MQSTADAAHERARAPAADGSQSGHLASSSQTQLQPTISKDNALLPRILHYLASGLGLLLQVKLTAHSVAKAKAPSCSGGTSAAEGADAAQTQAPVPADLRLALRTINDPPAVPLRAPPSKDYSEDDQGTGDRCTNLGMASSGVHVFSEGS